jgi:3-oxoacyl-[acyl-carrier-protein] synthase II
MGAVTPLGLNADEYWQGLVQGKCGIGPITLFDASLYSTKIAAEVKNFDPAKFMPLKRVDRTSRCTQFAIAASRMAVESAGLDMARENADRVGVIIATTGMIALAIDQGEVINNRPKRIDPLFITKVGQSLVPAQVGLELGARGINTTVNCACASGNDALGAALSYLRSGYADVIIAGGSEMGVNKMALASCGRVGAISRQTDPLRASRPFDLNRDGFVLGEGAGLLVLETLEHATERGASILAELSGAGWSFDAFNETAPCAEQQAVAIKNALRNAAVSPDQIDYINAHGTGTKLNDSVETSSIKMVLGDKASQVPISSNKSMIGHLAAAAGAVEAIAAVLTIQHGIIPPTIGYETPDPECDLDYVPNTARDKKVDVCLSNAFGMGGQNCCLVLKKFE